MFSTSRYQPNEINIQESEEESSKGSPKESLKEESLPPVSPQQASIVKYKTEPNEILENEMEFLQLDQTFKSSRKSEGKSKTKFFLDDFRKLIET